MINIFENVPYECLSSVAAATVLLLALGSLIMEVFLDKFKFKIKAVNGALITLCVLPLSFYVIWAKEKDEYTQLRKFDSTKYSLTKSWSRTDRENLKLNLRENRSCKEADIKITNNGVDKNGVSGVCTSLVATISCDKKLSIKDCVSKIEQNLSNIVNNNNQAAVIIE